MPEKEEEQVERKVDQKKGDGIRKAITKIADIGGAVGSAAGLVKALLKIFNNRDIYLGMGAVTPAANPNRPMNPAFNSEFSKNGTTGVPRLADVYTKWTEYGDSYATQLAAEDIFDKLVAVYHYNRPYSADTIKQFLVDGAAICFGLTQLLRDASWVRFPDQDIIEFATLYRKRSAVKDDGVGLVDLYVPEHLEPSKFPQTLDDLVPIMNDASKVILPNNILEFINHYYGNLFVVDADAFNDQVVRMIMTEMDWFDLATGELTTTDVNEWTLEYFANTLRSFIKKFSTLIADINSATLMSNVMQRLSYLWDLDIGQPKRSTMVYDKTFEQALINAYTSDSSKFLSELFKNEYIRLDFIPQVEDELTTFMFLGGAISYAASDTEYKVAKPVTVRCEVLKFDSNPDVAWPSSIQSGSSDLEIKIEDQFGYMITSNPYVTSTEGFVQVTSSWIPDEEIVQSYATDECLVPMKTKALADATAHIDISCQAKASLSVGSKAQMLPAGYHAYLFIYHGANLTIRDAEESNLYSHQLCPITVLKGSLSDGATVWTELGQVLVDVTGASGAVNFARLVSNKSVVITTSDMTYAQVAAYITSTYPGLTSVSNNNTKVITATGTPYTITGYKFFTYCSITMGASTKPKSLKIGFAFIGSYTGKYAMLSNLIYDESGLAHPALSLLEALVAQIEYSTGFVVDLDNYENLTVGVSGSSAPNFIVGLSACHLPIIIHYVSFNPDNGSQITAVGTPELVKANYIPLFYSLTDIKAIMYKMIGSLFKVSKRELKEK